MDVDRLAELAAQLTARVRDEAPDVNARWLRTELSDPADWFRLCFVLACAVPDDRPWRELVAWVPDSAPVERVERRRQQWRESKRRARAA